MANDLKMPLISFSVGDFISSVNRLLSSTFHKDSSK